MSSLFVKDEAPGTNVGQPIAQSTSLFVANEVMSAEDVVKTLNRRSSTWSGRYASMLNIQYNEDDVSGYQGQGATSNSMGISAHVKVPVARIHGGVEDAETGMINPYGKIVVGKFIIGDGTNTLPLDLSALEANIQQINKGRSVGASEDRVAKAMAELPIDPTDEQMEQKRQAIKERGIDRMSAAESTSFDEMMSKAGQQAEQTIPAIPQVPQSNVQIPVQQYAPQPVQQHPAQMPAYEQQHPVAPQIDMQTLIEQTIAKTIAAQEPAKQIMPEPEEPVLDLTPGITVTLKGWFGTQDVKYKGYEKQDNMLILMYNIGDNMFEPLASEQPFEISIDSGNGIETYTVGFVGISFKIESLRIGFQVYIVK